jgi:hypothetical protein
MVLLRSDQTLVGSPRITIYKSVKKHSAIEQMSQTRAQLLKGFNNTSAPADAISVDSSGQVGVGTTSPQRDLHIHNADSSTNTYLQLTSATTGTGSSDGFQLFAYGSGSSQNAAIVQRENAALEIWTNNTEKARLDSSGRLLVGTTSAREHLNDGSDSTQISLEGTTQNTTTLSVCRNSNNDGPAHLVLGKSRGGSANSTTIVQSGDTIGHINFEGADGTHLIRAGQISCTVDGTPGANDMPGRIKIQTCPNGSASLVTRVEISNQGRLDIFASSSTDAHFVSSAASAGTSVDLITGKHSAGSIGSGTGCFAVKTNGNVVNTNNSYGAISDVKLKENIADASSQWDDIKAVKVRNYNFKEETGNPTHTQIGVVAQEIETVSPGLVYETPDRETVEVPILDQNGEAVLDENGKAKVTTEDRNTGTVTKSVNYSVLYMKAIKALQEAQTRIETLETQNADLLARVTALEAA